MKTIEFAVLHLEGKKYYTATCSPPLNRFKEIDDGNFAELLLRTLEFISTDNPAREPIKVRLPDELPAEYKRWLRTSFLNYSGNKGVVVLYPNNKGNLERLWELE